MALAADAGTELAAGGTLVRLPAIANPGILRRIRLVCEMLVIFLGAPLILQYAVTETKLPLFVVLQPLLLCFIVYLLADRSFLMRRELTRGFGIWDLVSILSIFLIAGGIVAGLVSDLIPRQFLSFPRERPETFKTIVLLYPLLSVVAQELVYRTFFFHRYGPLFGGNRWLLIVTNGVLFGFAHLLFGNWVAVVGTMLTGTLFAYRYEETRSFWAVWLEHTLWGWLVFTVGLGGFFFTGTGIVGFKW